MNERIEQAAKEYAKRVATPGKYDLRECEQMAFEDFIAGVEYANRWISIDDELPPYNESIIINEDISARRISDSSGDYYEINGTERTFSRHAVKRWKRI